MKEMEDGGNILVNSMLEAIEAIGKPQSASKLNIRKAFAKDKYKGKKFLDSDIAIRKYKEAVQPPPPAPEEEEDDTWLDFDDLFPSPTNNWKGVSPKKGSQSEIGECDDGFPSDFPAFPEFDSSKADLRFSKVVFAPVSEPLPTHQEQQKQQHQEVDVFELTMPTRSRSLDEDSTFWDDDDVVSRPTVENTRPRRATLAHSSSLPSSSQAKKQTRSSRILGRRSSDDVGGSTKQHTITMELSKPGARSAKKVHRRRQSLDNDTSLFRSGGGMLKEESPDMDAFIPRSRSLDDDFRLFDNEDDDSEEKNVKSSSTRQRSRKPSRALSPFTRATAATKSRRSRSMDRDLFDTMDEDEFPNSPRFPTSPKRNSDNSELIQSLHTEVQNVKNPTRNSTNVDLSRSLHPSFKSPNQHAPSPIMPLPTESDLATSEDEDDAFKNRTKSQSLRVSMARRRAKMEDFASGWNSNVSLQEMDDNSSSQRSLATKLGSSTLWNPKVTSVAEEGTVSSFTHVADELSASAGGAQSRISKPASLSDLADAVSNQKEVEFDKERGVNRSRSFDRSMKIKSARLKVRKSEEKMASLLENSNHERRASLPNTSHHEKLEHPIDSPTNEKEASSMDGSDDGTAKEKRKFSLFPQKEKSPEFVGRKRNQLSPENDDGFA